MKNRVFSLLVFFSIMLSFTGCGLLKSLGSGNKENTDVVSGVYNMYQIRHDYNAYQLDSMCVADALPQNLSEWYRQAYQDYETGKYVIRYSYIKEMNDNYEMVYIVTQRGDIYVVSKRKVINE